MNRLKQLLFAGTLVPAIALTPLSGAFAQAPDQDHAPGGAMRAPPGGGAMRGPQGGAGGMMKRDGEMPRGGAMRGEGARAAGGGAAGAAGGAERQRAETPQRSQLRESLGEAKKDKGQRAGEAAQAQPGAAGERTPRAADAQRMAPGAAPGTTDRPRRDAATPDSGARRTGATERTGTPAQRDAATPPAATPDRAGTAARDDRRTAPANAAEGARPGAPASAAQDDRRAAPGPNDRMQGNNRMPGPNDRMQGNNDRMPNDRRDNADRNDRGNGNRDRQNAYRNDNGISPGGAAAIGAAAGFAGGFLAATSAQRLDDVRRDRREIREDGRTYIREPGRTIVEDGDRSYIVHDENDRFRELGYDVRRERRGRDYIDTVDRPGGVQIITYTDDSGRMLRRIRRDRSGREFVLIDNSYDGGVRNYRDDVVDLPPPPMRIPRDRYAVDYGDADEGLIYDTLVAPPLAAPPKRYTLDQIRYSPDVRSYVRSVDINTINFDTGSWIVPGSATGKLQSLASAIKRATERNPNSVFLVEGYTDATGNPTDNLSLSDRRAQSVAAILTKSFGVPPENLTTQGYGQQNLKVNTQGPSAENRRVVVQNITQLLASNDQTPPPVQ